jgi:hypothetical protein
MANTIAELNVALRIEMDKFKSDLDKVKGQLVDTQKKADSSIGGIIDKFKSLSLGGIAAGAAVGVLVSGFKVCIDAAAESEAVVSKLNQVIKATGGVAGVTSKAAQDLASSLQDVTTFDDEAIMAGETLLLTFDRIGKDVFPKATEAMLDMATVMGGDASSAAFQLGKALQQPEQASGLLRRAGVQLTADQERQIKAFREMGDVASGQKIILDALAAKMGGSARAAAETYEGRLKQLNNAFGDLKETVGNLFIGKGGEGLTGLKTVIQEIDSGLKRIQIIYLQFQATMADINAKLAIGEKEKYIALKKQIEVYTELRKAQGLIPGAPGTTTAKAKPIGDTDEMAKTREETHKALLKLEQDYNLKRVQLDGDAVKTLTAEEDAAWKNLADMKLKSEKDYTDAAAAIHNYYLQAKEKAEMESNLKIANQAIANMQGINTQLGGLFQQYNLNKTIELDNEQIRQQERIDAEYNAQKTAIENSTDDERTKVAKLKALDEKKARDDEKLQKDIEKKKRQLAREAAKRQKAISIVDAIMNTARGVTAALGMFPPPVAWAMAAINAALGAAQVALIASQPLPEAATGGVFNSPYIGGEAGAEMALPLESTNGQKAIRSMASGMLDVMSQSVDTRATVDNSSSGSGSGNVTNLIVDGAIWASWITRASKNGLFSIDKKVIVS